MRPWRSGMGCFWVQLQLWSDGVLEADCKGREELYDRALHPAAGLLPRADQTLGPEGPAGMCTSWQLVSIPSMRTAPLKNRVCWNVLMHQRYHEMRGLRTND